MVKEKIDSLELLSDIANKLGFKLVKRHEEQEAIILPKLEKEYDNMSVKEILVELKDTEIKMRSLEERDNKIKNYISTFINKQSNHPEALKKVLLNGKLDERKLFIQNKELILFRNLKLHLEQLLESKMVNELADHFLIEYRELNSVVKDIKIENTPTGEMLQVNLKENGTTSDNSEVKPSRSSNQIIN